MAKQQNARNIPERFLRQLWKQTTFETADLKTSDGKPVEIISAGTLNTDGGPDFTGARVRIGGTLYRGEVELHRTVKEWEEHSHHLDPKYNGVILHVVLHGSPSDRSLPTVSQRMVPILILEPFLNTAYHDLWQTMILGERAERLDHIKCFKLNKSIETTMLQTWVSKLALERIELKVRRFEERLLEMIKERKQASLKEPPAKYKAEDLEEHADIPFGINPEHLPSPGQIYTVRDYSRTEYWEQIMYEGILEGLGYAKNQVPFAKLARNVPLRLIREMIGDKVAGEDRTLQIESILFAASGLLPVPPTFKDKETALRVAQLRTVWNRLGKRYRNEILTIGEWQFFRLRPENFPTVRIAGAARIIANILDGGYLQNLVGTMKNTELSSEGPERKVARLESMLIVPADEYWSRHYTFGEASDIAVRNLVGKNRASEILLNVFLPVSLLYARTFKDRAVREGALEVFQQCAARQENTIVRKIDDQLIRGKFKLDSAMSQQGALQLYKLYCLEERCSECAVGKVVFDR